MTIWLVVIRIIAAVVEPNLALTSAKSIICIHAPGSSNMRIPLWVITYWLETIHIKPIKQKWVVAKEKLQSLKKRRDQTDETLALIKRV